MTNPEKIDLNNIFLKDMDTTNYYGWIKTGENTNKHEHLANVKYY